MKLKPVDSNAATHLIRCALGGEFTITNSNIVFTYMFYSCFCIVMRHGTSEYQSRGSCKLWSKSLVLRDGEKYLRDQVLDIID